MESSIQTELKEYDNMLPVKKLFTLIFLKKNNSVLLGFKTRGLGKGLWNGFGGKIEKNESVVDCAKRELQEECSLVAKDLRHIGVVRYELIHNNFSDVVHIFTCTQFEGVATPSEEMNPLRWYNFNSIPYSQMWPDSIEWYPYMLADKYFSAKVTYIDDNTIEINIVQEHDCLTNALKLAE